MAIFFARTLVLLILKTECLYHSIFSEENYEGFLNEFIFFYSKAGIGEVFEGHQGPVTGINCHMAVGPIDFSHLFVTSSFDWTVKLWTTKVRNDIQKACFSICPFH